ncbi:MAG: HAMP domain-containing histidine kinase [Acidobacteria bacterium]|nr:HAMP domain-containing histidine kinase [Acidobacteriota bacterium]
MLRSLRTRILLMTAAVVGIAVVAVGLLSRSASLSEFGRYVAAGEASQGERIRAALEAHWTAHASWEGVATLLKDLTGTTGRPLVLLGTDGAVIAVAPERLATGEVTVDRDGALEIRTRTGGDRLEEQVLVVKGSQIELRDPEGNPIGRLYVLPPGEPSAGGRDRGFAQSMNRSVPLAVGAAGLVAIFIAAAVSRRILRPIEALTEAARRVERGELGHSVEVASTDEIGDLARAFNAMSASVARSEKLRRAMVADVAHELRTPLTNIRGQLEAIQDELVTADRAAIDSLHEEAMLLKRVVDDLQEMALAEAGELRLAIGDLDATSEIAKAVAAVQAPARAAGVTVAAGTAEGELRLAADPERLGQILRNLLSNAIAHTPAGGQVVVGARRAGGVCEISVRDTGEGIAAEHLPFVFERFYRADPSRARATGGAGLGLAIVKQLAEAHGGSVRVESVTGKGSTFTVTLPIAGPTPS